MHYVSGAISINPVTATSLDSQIAANYRGLVIPIMSAVVGNMDMSGAPHDVKGETCYIQPLTQCSCTTVYFH